MTVLAVIDRGTASSDEVLSVARGLGAATGLPVEAVAVPDGMLAAAAAEGLAALVEAHSLAAVLAPATERATEVMAHLAARARLPLATNCVTLEPRPPDPHSVDLGEVLAANLAYDSNSRALLQDQQGDGDRAWTVTRIRGGGVLLEEAELGAPTKLLTLAPGAKLAHRAAHPAAGEVPVRELPPSTGDDRVSLVERTTAGGGVTLATAPVVVSGGRGIGSAEGFAVLEELAELLGGAVGCSRVATNNGWRPHSDQVGQTGAKVMPKVYIAAGISGATQHWAGCMGAKTILAINTDPDAPMVTRADYAVIGDAQEVLRAVTHEIRTRRSR